MLNHLKTFWKAISTGWVVEYPEHGEPPRDFFDRRDRRPIHSRSDEGEGEVDVKDDVAYQVQRQQEEEEEREDAVFRWSEQMRLKAENERR